MCEPLCFGFFGGRFLRPNISINYEGKYDFVLCFVGREDFSSFETTLRLSSGTAHTVHSGFQRVSHKQALSLSV